MNALTRFGLRYSAWVVCEMLRGNLRKVKVMAQQADNDAELVNALGTKDPARKSNTSC